MLVIYVFTVLLWCVGLHETCLPDVPVSTMFFSLCTAAIVFYATHRLGHEKQAIFVWFRAHTYGHHYLAYPSHTPQSDKYVPNTIDVYHLNTYAYVISGVCHLTFCYFIIMRRWDYILALIVTELILLYIENYFHLEVHKRSSKWQQWAWFRYIRECHMQHHRLYTVNFAVVALWTDWLCGTLAAPTDKDNNNNSNRNVEEDASSTNSTVLHHQAQSNMPATAAVYL